MKIFFSLACVAILLPSSPVFAQKTLEQQAEALLDKAERTPNPQTKQNLTAQAEALFTKAVTEAKNEAVKAKGDKERREAQFKTGVLLMAQSRAYTDLAKDAVLRKRAEVIEEARKTFAAIAAEYDKAKIKDKDLAPLVFKCRAWLYKCCDDGGDPPGAKENLEKVQSAKTKDAEEAQALIRMFRLTAKRPLGPLERARAVQKEADAWLKDYANYKSTSMGFAVRYEQAAAMFTEADFFTHKKKLIDESLAEMEKDIKEGKGMKPVKSVEGILGKERYAKYLAEKKERDTLVKDVKVQTDRLAKVQAMCRSIMETDNDYSEKAKGLDLYISRLSVTEKVATDLSTFEQCYLRAQEDMGKLAKLAAQIKEAPLDAKPGLEKNRKTLFRNIAHTLNRGISLADAKTALNELDDARYDLLISYMAMQDPYRTAVAGEAMSKTKPLTQKGALAAGYAIQAYVEVLNGDPSEDNRNRMRAMAQYVLSPECQKAWAKESVTGVARFQLAMLLLTEGNRVAAIEQLKLVPKDYPAYLYAQAKLVFAAFEARDKAKTQEEKKTFADLARKTLAEFKQLPPDTDPTSATMYFHARMEETKLLYGDAAEFAFKKDPAQARKLYQQMNALLAQLNKELQSARQLPEKQREQLTYYMGTMQKYATLGLADFEYRGGNYDQVLQLTAPAVAITKKEYDAARKEFDAKKEAGKTFAFKLKDYQVTGEVLGLALRASVQKGKIDDARQILKVLEHLKSAEGGLLAESSNVMRNLVVDLEMQIQELQKTGQREKLKNTVANFSEFLDALIKSTDKKSLEKNDIFFLAKCYDSLDQHQKAYDLYALYPAPKFLNVVKKGDKDKFSDEQEKELFTYWYAQVQQAKQLRLSKKLPEAKKVLDAVMAHPNARQLLMAEKEQNLLLEDAGLYGKAIEHWIQFMNSPSLKKNLASDQKSQNLYFDAYYHLTYSCYKYSQTDKVKKANKDALYLDKAVGYIIRLESASSKEGWQIIEHRVRELLDNEKILNDAYKKKKSS